MKSAVFYCKVYTIFKNGDIVYVVFSFQTLCTIKFVQYYVTKASIEYLSYNVINSIWLFLQCICIYVAYIQLTSQAVQLFILNTIKP